MTISARLSRTLHVALGEDAAADMVTWMQSVDDHRAELRDLNDLTAARIEARFAQGDARIDVAVKTLEAKIDQRFAELLKWSFVFWCVLMATLVFARQ